MNSSRLLTITILSTLLSGCVAGTTIETTGDQRTAPATLSPLALNLDYQPPSEAEIIDLTAKAATMNVKLETDQGAILLELFPDKAPVHVANFLKLIAAGFYDGQTFHRVEPGFVIQAGDPQSKLLPADDPRLGTGGPGYTIKAEFNDQKHDRGTLAMARAADPDSAGSQFYITLAATPHLDDQYTVFGRLIQGDNFLDLIEPGDHIREVRLVEKSATSTSP